MNIISVLSFLLENADYINHIVSLKSLLVVSTSVCAMVDKNTKLINT